MVRRVSSAAGERTLTSADNNEQSLSTPVLQIVGACTFTTAQVHCRTALYVGVQDFLRGREKEEQGEGQDRNVEPFVGESPAVGKTK